MNADAPLQPGEHTGFIPVEPTLTDWKAGAESGILEQERLLGGNWNPYLTEGQWQRFFLSNGRSLETDACVSFSAVDSMEAFMNFMIEKNNYPAEDVAWLKDKGYFDTDGKVKLSPRFTAKMSGTTINGNNLPAVGASLRHDGVVPAIAWDAPLDQLNALNQNDSNWDADAWNIYYASIPQAVIDLGKEFALRFDTQYEWVAYPGAPLTPAQFSTKLAVSPLQIATAVCPPWNTADVLQACGAGVAHATLMVNVENNQDYDIRDHYVPFDKKFAPNYTITYAMRIVCVAKQVPTAPAGFTHHFSLPILFGETNSEVVALQDALKADGVFPLTVHSTGYYGSVTQRAVLAFQRKYAVDTPQSLTQLNGTRVGLKTIAELNKLFDK